MTFKLCYECPGLLKCSHVASSLSPTFNSQTMRNTVWCTNTVTSPPSLFATFNVVLKNSKSNSKSHVLEGKEGKNLGPHFFGDGLRGYGGPN